MMPLQLSLLLLPLLPVQEPVPATEQPEAEQVDPAPAQADEPAPTTTTDWEQWERLTSTVLSPDGRWMAVGIRRNDGTQSLAVRELATDEEETYEQGGRPIFSQDSRWLFLTISPTEEEREKLKEKAKSKVIVLELATGEEEEIEGVAGTQPSEDGRYLAMRRDGAKGDEGGADLVLRDLHTGVDVHFGAVGSSSWCETSPLLAMTVDAPEKAGNGVRIYDAATGMLRTLDSRDEKYVSLRWREDSADLAVLREQSFEEDEDVSHDVLAWRGLDGENPKVTTFDLRKSHPEVDLRVVDFAGIRWTEDGGGLVFGIKEWDDRPAALDEEEKEEEADDEGDEEKESDEESPEEEDDDDAETADDREDEEDKEEDGKEKDGKRKKQTETLRESLKEAPGVEVWHADDIEILPLQKKRVDMEERRSHLAILHLDEERYLQLTDDAMDSMTVLEGRRWGPRHRRDSLRGGAALLGDLRRPLSGGPAHWRAHPPAGAGEVPLLRRSGGRAGAGATGWGDVGIRYGDDVRHEPHRGSWCPLSESGGQFADRREAPLWSRRLDHRRQGPAVHALRPLLLRPRWLRL